MWGGGGGEDGGQSHNTGIIKFYVYFIFSFLAKQGLLHDDSESLTDEQLLEKKRWVLVHTKHSIACLISCSSNVA